MTRTKARKLLSDGGRIYGTMITAPTPVFLRALSGTGIDFVFLDCEHIPLIRTDLAWMCAAYEAAGFPPIVRVAGRDASLASVAADAGAWGVVFPYVESAEEAKALVGAVKHGPLKGRKLRERLAGGETGTTGMSATYIAERNQDRLAVANIESVPALEALEEICAVEGLDWLLIGPHDLTVSLGVPEQYRHPDFLAAIDRIIRTGRTHGLAVGYHKGYGGPGLDQFVPWAEAGLNVILHEADVLFFHDGLAEDITDLRGRLGEAPGDSSAGDRSRVADRRGDDSPGDGIQI